MFKVNPLRQRHLRGILLGCVIAFVLIVMLFPIFWIVISSFKQTRDIFSMPPVWLCPYGLEHYRTALFERGIVRFFVNSIIIGLFVVLISIPIGCLAGYSFARYKIFGEEVLLLFILVGRIVPPIVIVLPLFLLFRQWRIIDTYLAVIAAYTTFSLPFATWMMRAFFKGIPWELEEAALIDGCGRLTALRKVILPLTVPGMAVTGIFCFIDSWNEMIMAFILTSENARTLPVQIAGFISEKSIDFGPMFAAGVIALLPVVVGGILIQKYFVKGLTLGAIK